ncbi:hypothetical protein FOR85_12230 [Psychrobacter sp. YGAH215]|uniref:hypothetical protein n=1 Tax=Psychrobacter sp. YGAH215 TaxID=2596826 RepID=UPI001186D7D4|nr:hypothetical protein [Psychrobacter sp. YGAH215]TSB21708.1 hypothetical protein FOR85_12230 [Psychrobacter sp. YGAH215]
MLKKIILVIFAFMFCLTLIFINNNFYQPSILGKLKLRYISSNNYYLIYKNSKFAAKVTAVDSWYIEKPFVYGSTTEDKSNGDYDLVYFFINVCNGQKFQTKDILKFDQYLDNKNISDENRNWMSGINAINIKEAEYSSEIDCSKYN